MEPILNKFNRKNVIRLIHLVIVIIFAACIFWVYYCAWQGIFDERLYWASFILWGEAVALILNKGNCPLEHIHKKVGDEKTFFELFIPKPLVPFVVPFFSLVSGIGFLLLYVG